MITITTVPYIQLKMTTIPYENEIKVNAGNNSVTDQKFSGKKSRKIKYENSIKSKNKLSSNFNSANNSKNYDSNFKNNLNSNKKTTKSKSRTKKPLKNSDWSTSFDDIRKNEGKFLFKENSTNSKQKNSDGKSRKVPVIMINQSIQTDPPLCKQIDSLFNTPIKPNRLSLHSSTRTTKQKFSNTNDWNDSFDIITPIKQRRWSGETVYSENISLLSPLNSPRNSIIETFIMTDTTNTSNLLVSEKINQNGNCESHLINKTIPQLTEYQSKFDSGTSFEIHLNSIIELLSEIGSNNETTIAPQDGNSVKDIMKWNDVPDCCKI